MQNPKDRAEFLKLLQDCRKNGVISLEIEGLKLTLSAASHFPESNYKKKKQGQERPFVLDDSSYSEEDALFWSSAGIPDDEKEAN